MNKPWKTDKWFTSPWNFDEEVVKDFTFPDKIEFHDVSLRDGEQQAGLILNKEDKVNIAKHLSEIGIHRIEAGLPAVSADDEVAIKEIVQLNLNSKIFCFSRGIISDIKKAVECGVSGIIIEVPASRHIIKYGYGWTLDRAVKASIEATQYAKEAGLYTVFFPVDATREDIDWLLDYIEHIATEGHMDALTLVDTFGVCSAHTIPYIVRKIKDRIRKPLEIHFHNDFGLGVANSLQALAGGASVVHTTVLGIGERTGNAPYEDIALALLTLYGKDVGLRYDKMYEMASYMKEVCKLQVSSNRQIVGDMLFTVESGLLVRALRKCRDGHILEMMPFVPELVGHKPVNIALGKTSGQDSINEWLEQLNIELTDEQKDKLLSEVKKRSIQTKSLLSMREFKELLLNVIYNLE